VGVHSLPIAVAMIVRDEAAVVGRALDSVREVAAQVVVVDTGSEDDTLAVAQDRGAEVHRVCWQDDFAAARNAALAEVRQPWVLVLDADEELVADDRAALADAVLRPSADAYNLRVVSLVGTGQEYTDARVTRLFRSHPGIRYRGRVHEQVADSIAALGQRLGDAPVRILHTGYLPAVMDKKHKHARNLRLLEIMIAEEPDNPYWHFQQGQTLLAMGAVAPARAAYAAALKRLRPDSPLWPVAMATATRAAAAARDWRQAADLAQAGLARAPGYTDLWWLYGLVLLQLGDLVGADGAFRRCVRQGPPAGFLQSEVGVGTYLPKMALAEVAQLQGRASEALAWLLSALGDQPHRLSTWQAVATLTEGTAPGVLAHHLQLVLPAATRQSVLAALPNLPPLCRMALEISDT